MSHTTYDPKDATFDAVAALLLTFFMPSFMQASLVCREMVPVIKSSGWLCFLWTLSSRNCDLLHRERVKMAGEFNPDVMSSYYHQGGPGGNAVTPSQTNLNKLFDQYRGWSIVTLLYTTLPT